MTPLRQSPFDPAEAQQSGVPDSWEGVCDWVLGKRLHLWQELFEKPFLQVSVVTAITCLFVCHSAHILLMILPALW